MHATSTGVRAGLAAVAAAAAVVACLIPAVTGGGTAPKNPGERLAARAVAEPAGSVASSTTVSEVATPTAQPSHPTARRTPTRRPTTPAATLTQVQRAAAPVVERPVHRVAARPAHPASRRPTHRATSTHPASSGYQASSIAYSVLSQLNAQRHQVGAAPLRMNSELVSSAHRHNLAMAAANEMSHQLPGEAYFADRIRAAGYNYRYAGENIGWNSNTSTSGALALGSEMFAEGPGGEHWVNITSRHFVDVGVDVYIDTVHHILWLTEDFGAR